MKSYDEIANEFGMRANNTKSTKFITLIAAIPTKWIQNLSLTSNFYSIKNNITHTVLSITSCKMAYCLLIERTKLLPTKQQPKWCEKLQITADSLIWQNTYRNNYCATNETKIVIVSNSAKFRIKNNAITIPRL